MNVNLQVELSTPDAVALAPQLQAMAAGKDPEACFAVTTSRVSLSATESSLASTAPPAYAAIFVPATITESALDGKTDFLLTTRGSKDKFSKRLLSMVHAFLAKNFSIQGLLQVRHGAGFEHAPADVALVDLSHTPASLLQELLQTTNGQVMYAGPELILKVLMIHTIEFVIVDDADATENGKQSQQVEDDGHDAKPAASATSTSDCKQVAAVTTTMKQTLLQPTSLTSTQQQQLEIPACPVCIHRIDPLRLGLPKPETHQLCSKFCTPPNLLLVAMDRSKSSASARVACPRQRLLLPWPSPSHCIVCRTIDQYWQEQVNGEISTSTRSCALLCGVCQMQQTLWICLTCGFLGCGRYSNQHAAHHFRDSGHAFSLELATLRIWDYVTSGFVQRTDLLECPSSWPLLQPWVARPTSSSSFLSPIRPVAAGGTEKAPKKATMIGEEYEVLLQSALEEQAQHYEGQLTHLRAQLTAEHVDQTALTAAERRDVEGLQAEIAALTMDVERVGRELLDAQSEQAAHKNRAQVLLRQQQVAQDLVKQLEQETAHEQAVGRQLVEELEQQIADLTANQRMRHQFTQNEELQQAQIWGMTTNNNANSKALGKTGKKQRRVRK